MPTLPLSATSLALLAALLADAALGYHWRDTSANLEQERLARHSAGQLAHAQQQARNREHALQNAMEAIQHDRQSQLEAVAADSRVQDLTRQYASRASATAAPAAQQNAPAPLCSPALLEELDQLAATFAFEADRRMIVDKACEAACQAVRARPKIAVKPCPIP